MNIPLDKYEEFYVCDGHVYLPGEGVESMLIYGNRKVEQEAARKPYAMPDQKLRALISEILQTLPELQHKSVQRK